MIECWGSIMRGLWLNAAITNCLISASYNWMRGTNYGSQGLNAESANSLMSASYSWMLGTDYGAE